MTRDDIQAVLEKIPTLNDFGIGIFEIGRRLTAAQRSEKLQTDRASLLNSAEACTKVCEWLSSKTPIKTINLKHSSYGLKHMLEEDLSSYVTNGAFIAAAVHSGFPYKLFPDSPNVCFGISEKSLKS